MPRRHRSWRRGLGPQNNISYPTLKFHRSLRALEGLEARAPRPGQCRWRPEGRRYPRKTLKERLRYKPDVALAVDPDTAESANTNAMENAAAGIHSRTYYLFPH
jgi:hypothetical protein